ncbi:MAG TPA: cyclic nucleotide-binding domain-containing protein [Bryobacteraceae bacterium]|nr:cyclic nucleotide-binding domain-containing protein [Bryobacteraceae bacterium]
MTNGEPDLLKGLATEEIEGALALGVGLTIASGTELFHLGDTADRIFILQRGRIRLTLPIHVRGRVEEIFVEESTAGQTVGWSALMPPYRFTLTATALVDTHVIALSREALREYFARYPGVGYVVSLNLAAVIGQRLQLFQAMWLREMQRTIELRCA